jgi:hypothetical protein
MDPYTVLFLTAGAIAAGIGLGEAINRDDERDDDDDDEELDGDGAVCIA